MITEIINSNQQDILLDIKRNDETNVFRIRLLSALSVFFLSVILIFSIVIILSFSKSIQNLLQVVEKVAIGDLSEKTEDIPNNEIGRLSESINIVIETLKNATWQAYEISLGNFETEMKILSEEDRLGRAIKRMNERLRDVSLIAESISEGNYDAIIIPKSDKDRLGWALQSMTHTLKETKENVDNQMWLSTSLSALNDILRNAQTEVKLANEVCSFFADVLNCHMLSMYHLNDKGELQLQGTYAHSKRNKIPEIIEVGEGLIGQSAKEMRILFISNIPDDQIQINSSLRDITPKNLIEVPFISVNTLFGVMEVSSIEELDNFKIIFLESAMEPVAIAISMLKDKAEVQGLLQESQEQSQTLLVQQDELKFSNENLQRQSEKLRISEENLKKQQEKLQSYNEDLVIKTRYLERQKNEIDITNKILEKNTLELESKAEQLKITSRYKSEFLANMSHELRTPLNSLLLLSNSLAKNKTGNLSKKQVKSAQTIYEGGNSLLLLINDILDLSKIESGKMEVYQEHFKISDLQDSLERDFHHMAEERDLQLTFNIDPELPQSIYTDIQKLGQILKNLLSNALKFTKEGEIKVNFNAVQENHNKYLQIAVIDTGLGIPLDKQEEVFEAFQQVDGSITRDFGGTGLGLPISRRLADLLGGELRLVSEVKIGSTFTLLLPFQSIRIENTQKADLVTGLAKTISHIHLSDFIPTDLSSEDQVILIIEDDPLFADILMDFCEEYQFKSIHVSTAEEGLDLLDQVNIYSIILDMKLPGMNGDSFLDIIKNNIHLRHIPVHSMSIDPSYTQCLKTGAYKFLLKPIHEKELRKFFRDILNFDYGQSKRILLIAHTKEQQSESVELLT
ncbi:ATP-binding protein, partial [bacterium]|nr:ATP-binding protein [bacterium]